jgi:hypothetical protein
MMNVRCTYIYQDNDMLESSVKKGILIVLSIFKCLSQTSFPDYFT